MTRTRLAVCPLEDRAVPATMRPPLIDAVNGTASLTINGQNGDQVEIRAIQGMPTGYVTVTEVNAEPDVELFNSADTGLAVRNATVNFSNVQTGGLLIGPQVRLGGGLTVLGARASQTFELNGAVGGGVSYKSSATAADDVTVGLNARVGGGLNLQVGDGANVVRLKTGTVGGNLSVTAKHGADTVELMADGPLTVGGTASFHLGNGANTVTGMAANRLVAGKDFVYSGFGGADTLDLRTNGADVTAGLGAKVTMGGPFVTTDNRAWFDAVTVGGGLAFTGGAGGDDVRFAGDVTVGGDVGFAAGDGSNFLDMNSFVAGTVTVGGRFTYTGGKNLDRVYVDGTTIGGGALFDLKDGPASGQFLKVGRYMSAGVRVYGPVGVKAGVGDDTIDLARLYVGAGLRVETGAGLDVVGLDDTQVSAQTHIDLGVGDDRLELELDVQDDNSGNLGAQTSFGGTVKVLGKAGDDTANLSDDGNVDTVVRFGGNVSLDGGVGADTLLVGDETGFFGGPAPGAF